ncbi:carbonic anhydrase family protein [Alloacidobacterium dinghuense]|uniref:carbonic anhydrase n=1 Tax=Alloacidobacterium dinghuense TaxID=2763107 RepID=A0A7G8BDR1_9BACT|nr:carbonic anhydrase family protein [Alloacidobacterium dinghuense]QNI30681.1 carbonic anhydrase family protein [Alloacidobacterium dinghuense]
MDLAKHCRPALIFCALVLAAATAQQQHPEHTWDYSNLHGPSHWAELGPEFAPCANGHHQSPIDIRNPQSADLPPIQFNYNPSPLDIIDNGHTVMIIYAPGSFITVGGKRYELRQFHFHRPSEERINGVDYEIGAHLVHADQQGHLAVVAVLLQKGEDNPLVHELWEDIPKEKDKEEHLNNIQIDLAKLLPADRGYYTFDGSLTTPPCSEGVTWYVLKHPVTVTTAEIEQFSKLYRANARPTQPLYGRVVLESK